MSYLWHEGFLRLLPFLLKHLHLGEDAVSRGLKLPLLRLNLLHLVHQLIDLVIDACTGVKGFNYHTHACINLNYGSAFVPALLTILIMRRLLDPTYVTSININGYN